MRSNVRAQGNRVILEESNPQLDYRTHQGFMISGRAEESLRSPLIEEYRGKIDLILTSPPFILNTKKDYGNRQGEIFKHWLGEFGPIFRELLSDTGSLVVEMGNAWEPGKPVMSTLAIESLLELKISGDFELCQTFIGQNPTRLPSPAQWVTIERIRAKDSYTNIWWYAKTQRPYADNRNVLQPYSDSMKKLLKTGKYNHGARPSGHVIGETSFLADNGGAIPSNVLTISNTRSSDPYLKYCKETGTTYHPARMAPEIVSFFIKFLTKEDGLVLDPFGGSNTTGAVAEELGRRWISVEPVEEYRTGSRARFASVTEETVDRK